MMHGWHQSRHRRVRRHMFMKRRIGMMAAMGHGHWFDHRDHEGHWEPAPDEQIRWLEEYQRDLEQETADVASRISDLRSSVDSPGT